MSSITFTIIKPDAVRAKNSGKIIDQILDSGFEIIAMKMLRLSLEKASAFYAIHKNMPFYGELVEFMSGGNIIAAVLKKNNAVEDFRKLIGATNYLKAEEGTIRKRFATSLGENAIHGSDSDENARIEASFFFSNFEIF